MRGAGTCIIFLKGGRALGNARMSSCHASAFLHATASTTNGISLVSQPATSRKKKDKEWAGHGRAGPVGVDKRGLKAVLFMRTFFLC